MTRAWRPCWMTQIKGTSKKSVGGFMLTSLFAFLLMYTRLAYRRKDVRYELAPVS